MLIQFYQSTIGKKVIVALTGILLFGFVVGHLLGNLQVFAGPEKINEYAAFLKANPPILWGTRLVLLAAVFLHVITIIQLNLRNKAARPQNYQTRTFMEADWAARFMLVSGVILLAYIIFHLLHLTVGSVHPDFSHTDVYGNLITGFSSIPVSLFYILGMLALGFHLYHGVWSVFQTLGLNHDKYNSWRRCLAIGAATVLTAGYISIPVAVMFKVIQ